MHSIEIVRLTAYVYFAELAATMVPKSNRKSLLEVRRSAGKRSVKVRGDSPYPVTVHHSSTTTEDVLVEGRVDSIQGMRICEGVFQYWVHWANYDEKDNSWEPVENLTNCHDQLVAWYKATQEYKRVHTQQTASKSAVSGLDLIEAARSAGRRVDGQPRESASSSISLLAGGKPSGRLSNGKNGFIKRVTCVWCIFLLTFCVGRSRTYRWLVELLQLQHSDR